MLPVPESAVQREPFLYPNATSSPTSICVSSACTNTTGRTAAVAGAVAVSSKVAVALSGAGADVRNRIYTDTTGLIQGGRGLPGLSGHGVNIFSSTIVDELVNLGQIAGGGVLSYGVNNAGSVISLTNAQGGTASANGALTYNGLLPQKYTMIVNTQAAYGQLAVTSSLGSASMVEATSDLGSALATQRFADVITGVTDTQIINTGAASAFKMANGVISMLDTAGNERWDLRVLNFGQDMAEPQRLMLEQRGYAVRFGLGYSCDNYGSNGFCMSFQYRSARAGGVSGETAGVLIGSKRFSDNFQAGVFREFGRSTSTATGLEIGNRNPMTGAYLSYTAAADNTGLQGRLAYATESSTVNASRANMLGAAETVTGKGNLDTSGVELKLGWGVAMGGTHVLTPFVALSNGKSTRQAYAENAATGVDALLSYSAYGLRRVATTAGLDMKGLLRENLTYRLSAGIEQSTYKLNNFDVTGAFGTSSYAPSNMSSSGSGYNASAGLTYKVNEKVSIHLNGALIKQDTSQKAAHFVSTGVNIGF